MMMWSLFYEPLTHPNRLSEYRIIICDTVVNCDSFKHRPTYSVFTVRRSDGQYCFRQSFFFSVTTITHEPLHLARWSFAWTCNSTTSRNLLNLKVVGQRSRAFWLVDKSSLNCVRRTWETSYLITPFSACRLLDPFQRYSRSKSTVVRNLVHCW